MTLVLGSPALRLLARKKLAGTVRSQLRRLRRPSGIFLALVGLAIFGSWIAAVQLSQREETLTRDPEELVALVRLGALFLTLFSIGSSVTHRGLFMPSEEIERLLSAPVSRSDVVRYRLVANAGRSLFAGLIFGLILMGRMPNRLWAFFGLMMALQTLPVVGQATAILSGALEKRSVERLRGWPGGLVRITCFVLGLGVFFALALGGVGDSDVFQHVFSISSSARFAQALHHPVLDALTIVFEPWARAITAPDAQTFAVWILPCLAVWIALFEGTARLPIDFRELSLETSANVAERIRRHRRAGGGASAAAPSKGALAWRAPWFLGRGPMGAIAWRKAVGILRKARGTLLVSVFVLALVTLLSSALRGTGQHQALGGAILIAVVGTLYLAGGLRFDFREDLDRMEAIKAWPLSPRAVFAATILPETLLVSGLLAAAISVRAAAAQEFDPWLFAVLAAIPPLVFCWIALDNAVFLAFPVRFVPGQEGAMQNAGRAVLLMFLRGLLFGSVAALVLACFAAGYYGARFAARLEPLAIPIGCALGWLALFGCDLVLARIGGALFRRFDVSRIPV